VRARLAERLVRFRPQLAAALEAARVDPEPLPRIYPLRPGERLAPQRAPRTAGRAFAVRAVLELRAGKEGGQPILAQEDALHGWALRLREGRLSLALRRFRETTVVEASGTLPAGAVAIEARVGSDGAITLLAGGRELASGKAPGPLLRRPGHPAVTTPPLCAGTVGPETALGALRDLVLVLED
jgi:hypothetical protein